MKKSFINLFVAAIMLYALPVEAAMAIPTVAGIPEGATAAQLIVYFFNLAIAIGSFIAIVMLIMAGIDYVMSRGEPAKIEGAKKRIQNAFLGTAVLMSSLIILNIINPDLAVIKINTLSKETQPTVTVPEGKTAGIFLYKADGTSLAVSKSMPSLVADNFQKQVQSIKIVHHDNYKYGAVLFTEGDFRGYCSYALGDISNLGSANGSENNPPIGTNTLSSVLVFKALNGSPTVKMYNTVDCKKRSDEYGKVEEKTSVCSASGKGGFENIKDMCPDFIGEVLSIEATTDTGVLLKTASKDAAGRCQFLTSGTSTCINVVKYDYIYNRDGSVKPSSYMLFPLYVEP